MLRLSGGSLLWLSVRSSQRRTCVCVCVCVCVSLCVPQEYAKLAELEAFEAQIRAEIAAEEKERASQTHDEL